ncbi:uncharacterized protein LOC121865920 [Homarus americanus]|uniref:uncharacterized protein LOC121860539 n=1 Tax=Homarus americanus TaxID=6706 RepID=UPI001C4557D9|nr:uncharacterized protein LOC121860539 [Homarus americanus]XP_042221414.1 uncharacterized protein LOC121865920 [Homarus americanus]
MYKSVSLNSQVMQGSDLNNKLMRVLIRFRQERVALMADIEAMFHQLLKGVAWFRRFIQWRFSNPKEEHHQEDRLKISELDEAILAVLSLIQRKGFPHEMDALERGHSIRTGDVSRLEPYLGADGLFRVGGRLKRAALDPDQRSPILLPRDKTTELIVQEVHSTRAGHSGHELSLAALRKTYWIPKCRKLIDRVLRTCVICRRSNWKPTHQRRADLPEDWVHPEDRPFIRTGVDCFGPFMVKQGRARAKRWGCLFTCLATRAIHRLIHQRHDEAHIPQRTSLAHQTRQWNQHDWSEQRTSGGGE